MRKGHPHTITNGTLGKPSRDRVVGKWRPRRTAARDAQRPSPLSIRESKALVRAILYADHGTKWQQICELSATLGNKGLARPRKSAFLHCSLSRKARDLPERSLAFRRQGPPRQTPSPAQRLLNLAWTLDAQGCRAEPSATRKRSSMKSRTRKRSSMKSRLWGVAAAVMFVLSAAAGAFAADADDDPCSGVKPFREVAQEQEASILSGLPIDPKHANPKLKGWRISDSLRHFFADFGRFGVIANEWPPIKDSSWRLQELKDTKLRTFNNDVPKQGRRYDVFYNRQRVGSLEIADTSDYTIEEPRVIANLVIRDPRPISFDDISRFLTSVATLLSAGTGDEYAEARRKAETALTRAHRASRIKGLDASPEGAVEVLFLGSAAT